MSYTPIPSAHFARGQARFALDRFDEAALDIEEYVRLSNDASANSTLSAIRLGQGKLDEAERHARASAGAIRHGALARVFQARRLYESALAEIARGLEIENLAGLHHVRALIREEMNQNAEPDYAEAIRLDPEDWSVWANRGVLRGMNGDFERAVADLTTAIGLEPREARLWVNRGRALLGRADFEGAEANYHQALRLSPELPDALEGRGRARAGLQRWKPAIEDLRAAIRKDPRRAVDLQPLIDECRRHE